MLLPYMMDRVKMRILISLSHILRKFQNSKKVLINHDFVHHVVKSYHPRRLFVLHVEQKSIEDM